MSMCYLCDMCAKCTPDIVGDEWCTALNHYLVLDKLAIDYGRDDPLGICKHFEPKEGGDDRRNG